MTLTAHHPLTLASTGDDVEPHSVSVGINRTDAARLDVAPLVALARDIIAAHAQDNVRLVSVSDELEADNPNGPTWWVDITYRCPPEAADPLAQELLHRVSAAASNL